MPVFIVLGTLFVLSSAYLALIALPFVLLFVLAGLAWALVGLPYMLARAVSRRWHAHGEADLQTAVAPSPVERRR
jgi:hypothetical protein